MDIERRVEMVKYLNLMGRTRGSFRMTGLEPGVEYFDHGVAYPLSDEALGQLYEVKLASHVANRALIMAELEEHEVLDRWLDGAVLREEVQKNALYKAAEDVKID